MPNITVQKHCFQAHLAHHVAVHLTDAATRQPSPCQDCQCCVIWTHSDDHSAQQSEPTGSCLVGRQEVVWTCRKVPEYSAVHFSHGYMTMITANHWNRELPQIICSICSSKCQCIKKT